jgi:hypothetical protein
MLFISVIALERRAISIMVAIEKGQTYEQIWSPGHL